MEKHPYLTELINEIKQGKRIVLFPPGMMIFIAFIMLMIANTVLFFGSSLSIFLPDAETPVKATSQLASLLVLFVFVILPALMVLSGKKHFSIISFYYALALTVLSAIILLLGFTQVVSLFNTTLPLLACIAISITCLYIYNSASYRLLKEFYYLLKNPEANT